MARKTPKEIEASKQRLDAELVGFARRIGHHGVANFIVAVRQYSNAAITPEYARDLLARGGYPDPKA